MKRFTLCTLALFLLVSGLASPLRADICDSDVRPAATLLLPYFEVDVNDPEGVNTVFSINNADVTAVLAHVTLWTDLSVPAMDFNVYLTGFDMQVIDLRDLIVNGNLPQTASDGQDPTDTVSPQGEFSQDINFSSCTGMLPLPPTLPQTFKDYLRAVFVGQPSLILGGNCAGRDRGDGIARGYVTIDTVNTCTLLFPSDPGYFGPGGVVTAQNVLFGDYTLVNPGKRTGFGNPMVHIEADPAGFAPGSYSFYGRYVGWNGSDGREPLPTTFGVRYENENSDLIVWRDSKVSQTPVPCPAQAPWQPLGQEKIVAFDQEETPVVLTTNAFPVEAQRTRVGGNRLPVPHDSGWLYLNLNTAVAQAGANPPQDPAAAQAWVSVVTRSDAGRISVGYDAMRYDSACSPKHSDPGEF